MTKFGKYEPDESMPYLGGVCHTFTFANGYVGSVIRHQYSYGNEDGLWEVAVKHVDHGLVYDTPVTSDVEGRCDQDRVAQLLAQIEALPVREDART